MAIIFKGNERFAYRDPACFYYGGKYRLFFTVSEKDGGYMYNRVGYSESADLRDWSEPRLITVRDKALNFCSPGNILEHDGEYLLCVTSYPMDFPYSERDHADETARLFFIKTSDFQGFTEPKRIYPKGKECADEGRMIDPYLLSDRDGGGRYLLFYKQNGVSVSESYDLESWKYLGHTEGGENACVLLRDGKYFLIHSPKNGIGFKEAETPGEWRDLGVTTLSQDEWAWASGRLTAGFAMEIPDEDAVNRHKYALFFHGSRKESIPETHGDASLAVMFTDDFVSFYDYE